MSSVLSSFSCSLLVVIQSFRSVMQPRVREIIAVRRQREGVTSGSIGVTKLQKIMDRPMEWNEIVNDSEH
ncbi:hypothetical protein ACOMHN_015342 [Nucella lapillus]